MMLPTLISRSTKHPTCTEGNYWVTYLKLGWLKNIWRGLSRAETCFENIETRILSWRSKDVLHKSFREGKYSTTKIWRNQRQPKCSSFPKNGIYKLKHGVPKKFRQQMHLKYKFVSKTIWLYLIVNRFDSTTETIFPPLFLNFFMSFGQKLCVSLSFYVNLVENSFVLVHHQIKMICCFQITMQAIL